MARPRKPIDIDRRGALMREARSSFARLGYAGTSLSSVLRASGFPRSSFYHFFQEKGALFDAALADGLTLLADRIEVADPGTLTAENYWPTVLGLVEALGRACRNEDLAAVPVLFHLRDAPPSATRDRFERAAHQWCTLMVERGRALGKLERDLPADLHVELTWNMMVALDRWLATHPEHMDDSTRIACVLLTRMLKAADQ